MESQTPNLIEYGVSWHLPELNYDRSEPVLEIRHHITTVSTKESGTDFIGFYVFFSRPSESSKFIKAHMPLKNVFSLPSEPSTINVFRQLERPRKKQERPKRKEKEKEKKKEEKKADLLMPWFTTADMRIQQYRSGFENLKHLKHKLTEQEHGLNKDFNLMKGAYTCMNANVVSGSNISDSSFLKQHTTSGNTVLHLAASYGNVAMVEKVAEHAPQLFTAVNNNHDTALHVAARTGHGSTMKLLLNKFLLFVRRETNGHDHQSILEMMLVTSLTLFRNKQGNTFLHEAFINSSHNGALIFEAFEAPYITDGSSEFEASFKRIVHHLAPFAINVEGKSLLYLIEH